MRFLAHPDTGWISSMVPPLLSDWSELDRLAFDRVAPLVAAIPAGRCGVSSKPAAGNGASVTSS